MIGIGCPGATPVGGKKHAAGERSDQQAAPPGERSEQQGGATRGGHAGGRADLAAASGLASCHEQLSSPPRGQARVNAVRPRLCSITRMLSSSVAVIRSKALPELGNHVSLSDGGGIMRTVLALGLPRVGRIGGRRPV